MRRERKKSIGGGIHDDGPVVFPDAGITFLNPLVSADIKPCIDVLFRGIMKVITVDDEIIDNLSNFER